MAVFFDKYEITIDFNKQFKNKTDKDDDSNIDSTSVSFMMKDSIHELYPELSMEFKDRTGTFKEYLLTLEGLPLQIWYGLSDEYINCPYIIYTDSIEGTYDNNKITSEININAYHEYYDKQEIKSAAYVKQTPDTIMNKLVKNENFSSIDIDSTSNNYNWYQPLVTDAYFMSNMLLPNLVSKNSSDTPFFLFIRSDNSFNLKSYASMMDAKEVKTLYYVSQKTVDELEFNTINSFQYFKNGSDFTKELRNRRLFKFSKDDGSLSEEEDKMTDYPSKVRTGKPYKNNKNLPLFEDDKKSSFWILGEGKLEQGKTDNQKGRLINSMRNSFFLERYWITTYLDTRLLAGKTINLNYPSPTSTTNDENSGYFTDKYIIEESQHIWDSSNDENGYGYTRLLVSRKFLPDLSKQNYKLVESLKKK